LKAGHLGSLPLVCCGRIIKRESGPGIIRMKERSVAAVLNTPTVGREDAEGEKE